MKKKLALFLSLFILLFLLSCNNDILENHNSKSISNMTLREKVGQLFIVRPEALSALSLEQINDSINYGVTSVNSIMKSNYKKYPVLGFCLFAKNIETPSQIKEFNKNLKNLGDVLLAIDEEGGRVARLANHEAFNLIKYESPEKVAEADNTVDVYNMGKEIGKYLQEYGFNLDFAPVADVNSNPNNIIIGNRSFGSDPQKVAKMVVSFQQGLNDAGINGCLKHFPGHGDTTADTHQGYVETLKTWDQLLECELIPFKAGIEAKASMIMIAHISTPNITNDILPSTLSYSICTEKLRNELGFNGVIITDAMSMGAIHQNYTSGESAVKSILAGCDIILMPYDLQEAFEAVLQAVNDGVISQTRLNESVNRILSLKSQIRNKK